MEACARRRRRAPVTDAGRGGDAAHFERRSTMRSRSVVAAASLVILVGAAGALAGGPALRRHVGRAPDINDQFVRTQLAPAVVSGTQVPGVVLGPQFFPQSVASGDPGPDRVVLWTRVADPDLGGRRTSGSGDRHAGPVLRSRRAERGRDGPGRLRPLRQGPAHRPGAAHHVPLLLRLLQERPHLPLPPRADQDGARADRHRAGPVRVLLVRGLRGALLQHLRQAAPRPQGRHRLRGVHR